MISNDYRFVALMTIANRAWEYILVSSMISNDYRFGALMTIANRAWE